MKVVHVIPSVARSDGGPAEVVRRLAPELRRLGATVEIVTTDKGADASDADLIKDPDTRVARFVGLPRWTFSPQIVRVLWSAVRTADIVHIHSINTFPTTVALTTCALLGRPVVLQPHGALDVYHYGQRSLLKTIYTKVADRFGLRSVRAVAYSTRREEQDGQNVLLNLPSLRVPLGVDGRLFNICNATEQPRRSVVFLSRLARKKRLDLVLRAMPAILETHPDAKLFIAGPTEKDLTFIPSQLAADLNLTNAVTFLGKLDADQRLNLLASASVYVLPSDDESFGMAAAEALAAGCPVVLSANVGIAPEAAESGVAVLVRQEPAAIATAVSAVLDLSDDEYARLATDARDYALREFNWKSIAGVLLAAYEEMAARKRDCPEARSETENVQ
jgi:glycosyltransferase involved in cell wall biosynthesis